MSPGMNLARYNNSWYKPGSPVKRGLWYIINVIFFKSSWFPFYKLKVFLLRSFGGIIGNGVLIKPNVNIKYPWLLTIGDHVWIGEGVWIDNLGPVTIGNHVCISQGAFFLSGNHNYTKSTFDLMINPIIIEDGVWIGARSIVCGGAVCEINSVISVNSVVTGRLNANGIYKGNPATWIKERIIPEEK